MPTPLKWAGTKTFPATFTCIRPSTAMTPPSGLSRPAMHRSVVLLPQPLGPSKVNSRPLGTEKEIPFTAARSCPSPENRFTRPSTRR